MGHGLAMLRAIAKPAAMPYLLSYLGVPLG